MKGLDKRHIGVEIEFSNLPLEKSAQVITDLFGGQIEKNSRYDYKVRKSEIGDFGLELDAILLKKLVADETFAKFTQMFGGGEELNDLLEKTASKLVPYEIAAPAIPITHLHKIDTLVYRLRLAGALGTTHAFQYAFGVHLNIEPPNTEVKTVLRHFQSFLMLQLWLERQTEVDITRKFSPFIESFHKDYLKLVMAPTYRPKKHEFIKDYLAHNPTRNRILDMLPLFSYWDEELVRKHLPKEKIKARPTFHYRLPNSKIDLFHWRISDEWLLWQIVEKLANDEKRFSQLQNEFNDYLHDIFQKKDAWVERTHRCVLDLLSQ